MIYVRYGEQSTCKTVLRTVLGILVLSSFASNAKAVPTDDVVGHSSYRVPRA